MDTRTKIVDLDTARNQASQPRTAVVIGYFNPVLAEHARRMRELRAGYDRLIVIVADPAEPLMDAMERAQLVAALEAVDWVVLSGAPFGTPLFDERDADEERFQRLVARVQQRSRIAV